MRQMGTRQGGWLKLHRKIMDWRWYHNHKTFKLFIHILLRANFLQKTWGKVTIKRGQFITSYNHLSDDTGLSVQEVRTAIKNLVETNEILVESTNKFTIITVIKYEKYQDRKTDEYSYEYSTEERELLYDEYCPTLEEEEEILRKLNKNRPKINPKELYRQHLAKKQTEEQAERKQETNKESSVTSRPQSNNTKKEW